MYGPRHPEPFPSDGKPVKLLTCPVCKMKGVPYYFTPKEQAYPTACQKCGAVHVIHGDDVPARDFGKVQGQGVAAGPSPFRDGYRVPPRPKRIDEGLFDANAVWDAALERVDLGLDRWYKK